ncbi:oxidoreductase [Sorangium cellulosum]|uniref:Oxidoreductase n=2 Tax=Sorangium cellulosum TaxID=56 RepID=A0A2L0F0U9_SORCE|nr:Gfo/Idh/MocA family oxidoreductase [Sorangium cellulosum]AUX45157.1 oxidoreductase [Sorangium cellulosum]
MLGFGVIGTGEIARDFTRALQGSQRCRVVNVAGTSANKARAFAAEWGLRASSRTVEELLEDRRVEAVYVASPHSAHEQHALASLAAGKHVLCEKPLTLDAASTQRVIAEAVRRRRFLMEGFMYRCHPMLRGLLECLKGGAIGRILHLRADFGFRASRGSGRLFNPERSGGSVLDVGGYPVSFARLLAGVTEDAPFAEPTRISAWGRFGPTGVDELASATLTFPSGFTAEVTSSIAYAIGTTAVIHGERGFIVLPNPWIPGGDGQGRHNAFTIHRDGREPKELTFPTENAVYAIEAELVADSLPMLEPEWPAMSWADTLGNMQVMDAWRGALGSGRRPVKSEVTRGINAFLKVNQEGDLP